jgi:hypothetical protein
MPNTDNENKKKLMADINLQLLSHVALSSCGAGKEFCVNGRY